MRGYLTLAIHRSDGASGALGAAVEDVGRALEVEIRTETSDGPFDALSHKHADMVMTDAASGFALERRDVVIAAILRRHPARDRVIAAHETLTPTAANPFGIVDGARVGVSSPRHLGPLLTCCAVRASVLPADLEDPLESLERGVLDALVLSGDEPRGRPPDPERFAALELRHEVMLPAPGSNAYVLAAAADSPHLHRFADLNDPATLACVRAELELLRLLGPAGPGLGCLAHVTPNGAIRLAACLTRTGGDSSNARATRVAAITLDPMEAARSCIAAFEEIDGKRGDILLP